MLILDKLLEEIKKLKQEDANSVSFYIILESIKNILNKNSLLNFSSGNYKFRNGELIYRDKIVNALTSINEDLRMLYTQSQDIKQVNYDDKLSNMESDISTLEVEAFRADPNYYMNTTGDDEIVQILTVDDIKSSSNIEAVTSVSFTTAIPITKGFTGVTYTIYTTLPKLNNKKRITSTGKLLGNSDPDSGEDGVYYPPLLDDIFTNGYDISFYRTNRKEKKQFMKDKGAEYNMINLADDDYNYEASDPENITLNIDYTFSSKIFLIAFKLLNGSYPHVYFDSNEITPYKGIYELYNLNNKKISLMIDGKSANYSSQNRLAFELKRTKIQTVKYFNSTTTNKYHLEDLDNVEDYITELKYEESG